MYLLFVSLSFLSVYQFTHQGFTYIRSIRIHI